MRERIGRLKELALASDELTGRQAQVNPDAYRDLVVRVHGYSRLFHLAHA